MGQDDPRKCTSMKLLRLGLAHRVFRASHIPWRSVVLNPASGNVLTASDRVIILAYGVTVIDCSWELAQQVFDRKFAGRNRRLPTLMAGNPTNYGALGKLSSAEAVAAVLYVCAFREQAGELLSKFKWGPTFLALNENALLEYASASSPEEVYKIESDYFGARKLLYTTPP